ncbi:MAG: hypothetical protein IPH63_12995 [Flavobacteriales bacterium]|nr:hypothetical protein [Flavobacteriales bacterium]
MGYGLSGFAEKEPPCSMRRELDGPLAVVTGRRMKGSDDAVMRIADELVRIR